MNPVFVPGELIYSMNDLDILTFRFYSYGSIRLLRVTDDFEMTEDCIRNFFGQNAERIVEIDGIR